MTSARQKVGAEGERLARDFLVANGYSILEQNYRTARGEIDAIALDGPTLCFVEVRTLKDQAILEDPLESITPSKKSRIVAAARAYLAERDAPFPEFAELRFDAVGVLLGPPLNIRLLRGAFDVSWQRS